MKAGAALSILALDVFHAVNACGAQRLMPGETAGAVPSRAGRRRDEF